MKYFLQIIIFFSLVIISNAQTPLVISRENFNITASNDTIFKVSNLDGIVKPEEGANINWNYSNINVSIKNIQPIICKTPENPFFQNATCWFPDNFESIGDANGFYLDNYSKLSDLGYSYIGIGINEQKFYLGQFTDNPNDSLIFPIQNILFDNPRVEVNFPTTYGSVSKCQFAKIIGFKLTLGIFSYDHSPCLKITHNTQIDSVVGWGNLIVPNLKKTNGKSEAYNILLIKRYNITVDSLLINGEPAPPLLMKSFSLKQGLIDTTQKYIFMRENSKIPLLTLNYNDFQFTSLQSVNFDISTELSTSVEESNSDLIISNVFPNPSSGNISIDIPLSNFNSKYLSVTDVIGNEIISRKLLSSTDQNKYDINLQDKIPNGIYFYNIFDDSTKLLSKGKFIIAK